MKNNEKLKNIYTDFARPLNGKLLRLLNLDIDYTNGKGNWLTHRHPQKGEVKVFDATGGYGSNLLGHKNEELTQFAIDTIKDATPNNVQNSLRKAAAQLCKKLSELLASSTGIERWVTTLSNSGTEAVEAALKHALIYHRRKCDRLQKYLNEGTNLLFLYLEQNPQALSEIQLKITAMGFSEEFNSPSKLIGWIEAHNSKILSEAPAFLAVEGGFHGKSMGSLSVTANEKYSNSFFLSQGLLKTSFIQYDLKNLENEVNKYERALIQVSIKNRMVNLKPLPFSKIAAAIAEPIQGEGGIKVLNGKLLKSFRELADQKDFLLIFDEIQAGLFRTGNFLSSEESKVIADTYCFAKALGGGLAKIGATSICKSKYIEEFGYIHTSTFSEDEYSSLVGLKVLEILERDIVNNQIAYLKEQLDTLTLEYSEIIYPLTGEGLMLAIEFRESSIYQCLEFKIFDDAHFIGYLFASAILFNNNVRISPSLSNQRVLRIEPSIYTTRQEIDFLIAALKSLLNAIGQFNMPYFLSHLFTGEKIGLAQTDHYNSLVCESELKNKTLFLCHMVNSDQSKNYLESLKEIPDSKFRDKVGKIYQFSEFGSNYKREVLNDKGQGTFMTLHVHPITSEDIIHAIKTNQQEDLIDKIQHTIYYAKENGYDTVGLGQFTSILSNSGLSLDSLGLNLTTGNAYTTFLSVEATKKACIDHSIDLASAEVSCIGAAGNIVSVNATLIGYHCKSLNLVYHTEPKESLKFLNTIIMMIEDLISSNYDSKLIISLKKYFSAKPHWKNDILNILEDSTFKQYISYSTDVTSIENSQVVIAGASSSGPLIFAKHIKEKTVLIDIAVPGNIERNIERKNPLAILILGGIAKLPKYQGKLQPIDAESVPLPRGSVFACLAETLILSMTEQRGVRNIGPLTTKKVLEVGALAKDAGFTLGLYKQTSTHR